MLKALRENFKHLQWILWLVIAVFVIFVFADWGMGSGRGTGGGDTTVAAKAGKFQITTAEFQREYKETEDRYRQMYGKNFSPELLKAMNLPEQTLNSLIDRRLMKQEAQHLGLGVTDDELSGKILSFKDQQGRPLFVKDGAFVGEATYRRMLAAAGYVPQGFEAQTREQILLEKLNRFFTESTFVGDDEVESDYASRNVKAKVAFALLPATPVAPGTITDAEAEEYFKKNPTPYMQPEKRKAKYLLVETMKVRSTVQVTDAEVAADYSANAESYRKGEQVKARHILYKSDATNDAVQKARAEAAVKKLKGGADFAALAKAESDDPGSKANGGDLGLFGRGQMVKEFEEAAFGAEPKKIVGPVKTAYGYHVIEVLEKQGERVQPLFEVSAVIRARVAEQKAAEEAKRLAAELSQKAAKLGSKPSDEDLRKLATGNVTFNESEFLGKGDAAAGGMNQAFTQALFSLATGEVSPPVSTPRGEAILKLVEIRKPGLPTFAEVKARLLADLAGKKQDENAAAALKQAAAPGTTLEDIAKKLNLKVETPESFGKGGPIPGLNASKEILDAAFAANVGGLAGPFAVAGRGAVILKVVEKTPFDKAAFDAQKEKLKESLKTQKSGRLLQAMILRRRADMKVEINKDLIARFSRS
jgi:peptidyl-prolyl cis-trans isomerase D